MKRRSLAAVLLVLLSLAAASCGREAPQHEIVSLNGFSVALYKPEVSFPDSIYFRMDAEADADICDIALHYRVDKLSLVPVTSVAFPSFEAGREVSATWTWDMRKTGELPPGTSLTYWWSMEDEDGNTAETEPASLTYNDTRFSWQSMESDSVTLLWYEGSTGFAEELLTAAQESVERLADSIGTQLAHKARLYVYDSAASLRGAMMYPQEWTGGVAYPDYGVVAIGISVASLDWGKGTIAHEIAHLVVYQFTCGGRRVPLPTWLDEGLAMWAQGGLTTTMESLLESAIGQGQLFSLKSLCSTFPTQTQSAYLAYAQSYSVVEFLLNGMAGGKDSVIELLESFKQGNGYEDALDQVYGLDIEQLDEMWRQYVDSSSGYVSLSLVTRGDGC